MRLGIEGGRVTVDKEEIEFEKFGDKAMWVWMKKIEREEQWWHETREWEERDLKWERSRNCQGTTDWLEVVSSTPFQFFGFQGFGL